ncbi:MAG: hypothetical protein IJN39_01710 [Clostridia bacterium]|nr:hypothetical protein [Clostridia bacterium]
MKKITGQFTKYTVILLIVGAILVLIGGLSVGRKAIANQREIALDMTARTRVDMIVQENAQLKSENEQLKKDAEISTNEKTAAVSKANTMEAFLMMQKYIDEGNIEKAKEKAAAVDATLLSEDLRQVFEEKLAILNNEE